MSKKYPEPKKFNCADCNIPIARRTKRCKNCYKKFRIENSIIKKDVCKFCKKDFSYYESTYGNREYCSIECIISDNATYKGVDHWNYKDGRTSDPDYHKKFRKEHRERYNLYQVIRTQNKRSNGGSFTSEDWESLKSRYNYTCLCCGRSEPDIKLAADHIIPITKGGGSDISNIQPLCGLCNSKKYNKIIDFRNEQMHQTIPIL